MPSTGGNVFKTTNGTTWTNISGDLATVTACTCALPVWSLQIGATAGTLYIGADDGVYVTTNGGTNWTRFGTGLPNGQVFQIELNKTLNILGAGIHGRSMWEISTAPAGLVPPTITKAFNPTTIVSGGTSLVTLTLSNSNATALTGAAFTDTLVNMSAAGGPVGGTCSGTTPNTLTAGQTALGFTNINLPASSSCTDFRPSSTCLQ